MQVYRERERADQAEAKNPRTDEMPRSCELDWAGRAVVQLFGDFDDAKKKQSRGTEAALERCSHFRLDDRFRRGSENPSHDTEERPSILWATQITEGHIKGSWEVLNSWNAGVRGVGRRDGFFGAAWKGDRGQACPLGTVSAGTPS